MSDLERAPSWSRRGILGAAAGLAGTAAMAPLAANAKPRISIAAKHLAAASGGASQTEWARLARALRHGRLLTPDDVDFRMVALPNNLRYAETLPAGIARCGNADEVAFALNWARQNHIPIATRGGGHSYAGYSTTTGLMIDTALLRGSIFDHRTGVIRVGAGARNRDLYRALATEQRAMTHGRCPSVGAAGFLLGGGIGFNMRARGMACDQVVGSELVTAQGERLRLGPHARDRRDVDLFWACRGGGGGNFGITTKFALETFSVEGKSVTVFDLGWTRTPDNKGACPHSVEEIGARLMQVLDEAPVELGSRISFGAVTPAQLHQGYDVPISLLGQFAGPAEKLIDILRPVYDLCPPNAGRGMKTLPYWPAQTFLHEDGYPTFYQERSAFVVKPFGAEELAKGLAKLRAFPGLRGYCDLRFFQTGGEINKVKPGDTAFVHRDSRWLMVVGLYWDAGNDSDESVMRAGHAWQDDAYAALRPLAGGGAYQNFPDPSLGEAFRSAYYGDNVSRLQAIRDQVDPDRVFKFPQAI